MDIQQIEKLEETIIIKLRQQFDNCLLNFLFEVRDLNIGDTTVFKVNNREIRCETEIYGINIQDILNSDIDINDKADKILDRILGFIQEEVETQFSKHNFFVKVSDLKQCIKIIIEDMLILYDRGEVAIRLGIHTLFN